MDLSDNAADASTAVAAAPNIAAVVVKLIRAKAKEAKTAVKMPESMIPLKTEIFLEETDNRLPPITASESQRQPI